MPDFRPKPIYLDHNSTTPLSRACKLWMSDPEIQELAFGNPSSTHSSGRLPKKILREARQTVASFIGAVSPNEVIFCSGGTEGNNTVLKGLYLRELQKRLSGAPYRDQILVSGIEHAAVIEAAESLELLGAQIVILPVSRSGQVDMQVFKDALDDRTLLVSAMFAHNETGVILPIREMAKMAHAKGAYFHTDAVQALGKVDGFRVSDLGVDYATFSAHKFYSPKGVGVIYQRAGAPNLSLLHGGPQERARRAGTENVMAIGGFAETIREKWTDRLDIYRDEIERVRSLRDEFEKRILGEIAGASITARGASRVANTSHVLFLGADGASLQMALDVVGVEVSTGAACSSGRPEPSRSLLGMGFSVSEAKQTLRFSFGFESDGKDLDRIVSSVRVAVERLREAQKSTWRQSLL